MNSLQVHTLQTTELMCTKPGVAPLDKHIAPKKVTYRGNEQNEPSIVLLDKCTEVYAFINKCRVTRIEGCAKKLSFSKINLCLICAFSKGV